MADFTKVKWTDIETICSFKVHYDFVTKIGLSGSKSECAFCSHGANGHPYRCCKLMCPVWDDLTGDGKSVNTVGLREYDNE